MCDRLCERFNAWKYVNTSNKIERSGGAYKFAAIGCNRENN